MTTYNVGASKTETNTAPWNGSTGLNQTMTARAAGDAIIVAYALEAGTTEYTYASANCTDDKGNSYTLVADSGTGRLRHTGFFYCMNPTSGVTNVRLAPSGGSGNLFGPWAIFSVTFTTTPGAIDLFATNTGTTSPIACGGSQGTDAFTDDFVVCAVSADDGSSNPFNIGDPPTGNSATYTTIITNKNAATTSAGNIAQRVNTSAIAGDSASWTLPANSSPIGVCSIASFKNGSAQTLQAQICI